MPVVTVAELIEMLSAFPPDTPVSVSYDCGTAEGDILRVERDPWVGSDSVERVRICVL